MPWARSTFWKLPEKAATGHSSFSLPRIRFTAISRQNRWCSPDTADQYVHDYSRIFGLPTVVFRMSCIAGPRQCGNEDQGWVAHFLYSALEDKPLAIFGDGKQVRDVLAVRDLVLAFE